MQRLLFWGLLICVLVVIALIIDQIYYRFIRLFLSKHTAQIVRGVTCIACLTAIGISYYIGHNITRFQVEVKHTDIVSSKLPACFDGFKVAQISDFHISSFDPSANQQFFQDLRKALLTERPDILVFTGDLVTIRSAEAYPFRHELASLTAETGIPVYSILGNHDYADYMRSFDDQRRHHDVDSLISLQHMAGWHMLNNASTYIYNKVKETNDTDSATERDSIALVGVENIGEPPFSVYGNLPQAMKEVGGLQSAENTFTILLSHNPIHWRQEVIPQTDIDLTLSGHTHAMQFKIGNWSPSKWKYPEWMGLYQEGCQYLYVNTGLGCVGPAIRIGVKPEISILTLRKK